MILILDFNFFLTSHPIHQQIDVSSPVILHIEPYQFSTSNILVQAISNSNFTILFPILPTMKTRSLQWQRLCTCSGPGFSLWPHLLLHPLLTWFRSPWPPCLSLKMAGTFYLRVFALAVCIGLTVLQVFS